MNKNNDPSKLRNNPKNVKEKLPKLTYTEKQERAQKFIDELEKTSGMKIRMPDKPPLYKPDFPTALRAYYIQYLNDCSHHAVTDDLEYPSVTLFAVRIGVTRAAIYNWAKEHPEMNEALEEVKIIDKEIVKIGGLTGKLDGKLAGTILKMQSDREMKEKGLDNIPELNIKVTDYTRAVVDEDIPEYDGDVVEDADT